MIIAVSFKIDNKVYNTTVNFTDCNEIIINIKQLKKTISEKLVNKAYKLDKINDVAYSTTIKNIIMDNIEIMQITIPNYDKIK